MIASRPADDCKRLHIVICFLNTFKRSSAIDLVFGVADLFGPFEYGSRKRPSCRYRKRVLPDGSGLQMRQ